MSTMRIERDEQAKRREEGGSVTESYKYNMVTIHRKSQGAASKDRRVRRGRREKLRGNRTAAWGWV